MAAITVSGLTKEFPGGVRALDALDLSIEDGEFFALLGPSGCGKTTLLRTIAGLETPSAGDVAIGERVVTALQPGARDVAMVFQDYALFPHMTVEDNIAYPLKVKRRPKPERAKKAGELSRMLGLAELLHRRPAALSGGQQQRVALARAMAATPEVFLLDEPLSNLDARLRLEARTFLKQLQLRLGITTVFVTHDQAEALALADRIAVLEAGRIRQLGTPREVFRRPANTFVAGFIGSTPMNLLPGTAGDGRLLFAGASTGSTVDIEGPVTVGIRPEYLTLSRSAGLIKGAVAIVEHLGAMSLVSVLVDDSTTIGVTVSEEDEPALGEAVWLTPNPARLLVYRPDDGTLME
jgi:multiple sugar transport system ATP-binding protein